MLCVCWETFYFHRIEMTWDKKYTKQYRIEHPEMVRMANRKYYHKNKERILAKAKERYANKKYKKEIEYIYKI